MFSFSESAFEKHSSNYYFLTWLDDSSYSTRVFTSEIAGLYVLLLKICNKEHGVSVVIRHNSAYLSSNTFQGAECFTYSGMVQMSLNDYVSVEVNTIGMYQKRWTGSGDIDVDVSLVHV